MSLSRLSALAHPVIAATAGQLPEDLRPLAERVPVVFEETPSDELIADGVESDTLGLFTGDPLGESSDLPLPPQIILFLGNLWDFAEGDDEAFREEVRVTFLHELGHYLGWDEDDVAQRGLD